MEEAIRLHQNLSKEEAKKKVLHLFEQVKLPNPERIYKAYPHELSGGQKATCNDCNGDFLRAEIIDC